MLHLKIKDLSWLFQPKHHRLCPTVHLARSGAQYISPINRYLPKMLVLAFSVNRLLGNAQPPRKSLLSGFANPKELRKVGQDVYHALRRGKVFCPAQPFFGLIDKLALVCSGGVWPTLRQKHNPIL